jgi:hypothetical protein
VTEIFIDFFEPTKRTVKGLKGYAILENIEYYRSEKRIRNEKINFIK